MGCCQQSLCECHIRPVQYPNHVQRVRCHGNEDLHLGIAIMALLPPYLLSIYSFPWHMLVLSKITSLQSNSSRCCWVMHPVHGQQSLLSGPKFFSSIVETVTVTDTLASLGCSSPARETVKRLVLTIQVLLNLRFNQLANAAV